MKKKYFDPEFELLRLSFEPLLSDSVPEETVGEDGDDNAVEEPE